MRFLGETGMLELERSIELCDDPRSDLRRLAAEQAVRMWAGSEPEVGD